jgi:penicillin G amidase
MKLALFESRRMQNGFLYSISAALMAIGLFWIANRASGPDAPALTFHVNGMMRSVEILYDPWHVPHIFADTMEDAFFGQGFAAAHDRLWQMDQGRRRGLGRLAEILGSKFVPYDHGARLFLYRGAEETEWRRYGPHVRAAAMAFTAGINAYIQVVRDHPDLLPLEFKRLGYFPEFWDPADLIRIRAGYNSGIGDARRAELACAGRLGLDAIAHPLEPPWTVSVPRGLNPCSVAVKDLRLLQLAYAPLRLDSLQMVEATVPKLENPEPDPTIGSNAWVIAPRLTQSGRPILANDPHLPLEVPSQRWITHLSAPGLNVIGASAPWNPGVQNGHNERVAFGRTNFDVDAEDVYVLTTKQDDPNQYLYAGTWRPLKVISESIAVAGEAPVEVTLKYSVMGPVVAEHIAEHRAIAVRAAWMEPGAATALQFILPMFASNWVEFKEAIHAAVWGVNYLYADVDGHIGWHPAGFVPIRPNHDGLLPVPGDGYYDWAGSMSLDELPSEIDPPRGWIANANQMPLPSGYPYAERKVGFEWVPPDRYDRIVTLLSGRSGFTLADMTAIQSDVELERAIRLVRLLGTAQGEDRKMHDAINILTSWDGRIEAGSAAAALYEAWWFELRSRLHDVLVPKAFDELLPSVSPTVIVYFLEHPDTRLGVEPVASRDALLLEVLRRAIDGLEKRLGPRWSEWSWGRLHTVNLEHPLASRLTATDRAMLNVDGGGSGGEAYTVMARVGSYPDANVTSGASFSMVLDVGDWDKSFALNAPGQSGDPSSAHYRDLYRRWLEGQAFPLLFDRDQIRRSTRAEIRLKPAQ